MLYEKILEYREELFDDLNRLLSIESVDGARDGDCAAALDFILKRAEDFGLTAERVTAKSAHVDLGKGGRLCGVLSHLDVVPAGNNWTVNPYALTERDGRLYGRGVADDKGAALVNLYCLRALKEMGIEGRNTLRAIYGTAEETGMSDMDGYARQRIRRLLCREGHPPAGGQHPDQRGEGALAVPRGKGDQRRTRPRLCHARFLGL